MGDRLAVDRQPGVEATAADELIRKESVGARGDAGAFFFAGPSAEPLVVAALRLRKRRYQGGT